MVLEKVRDAFSNGRVVAFTLGFGLHQVGYWSLHLAHGAGVLTSVPRNVGGAVLALGVLLVGNLYYR